MSTNKTLFDTASAVAAVQKYHGIMDAGYILKPIDNVEKPTVVITPEIAQKLLDQTDPKLQRPVSRQIVAAYAKDMREGRWAYNHQTIIQDTAGNAINGQHRLHACVKSGKPFMTDMVKGADYDAVMDTVDTGKNRTNKDILGLLISDINHHTQIVGAIRFLVDFANGRYADGSSRLSSMTNRDMHEFVDSNTSLVYNMSEIAKRYKKSRVNLDSKIYMGLYQIFNKIDADMAEVFFDQLEGINTPADSPLQHIRNRFEDARIHRNNKLKQLSYREKLMLMIKAWNDLYLNGSMRRSFYKTTDKKFPKIAGATPEIVTALYDTPTEWADRG